MTVPGGLISLFGKGLGKFPEFIAADVSVQSSDTTAHAFSFTNVNPAAGDLIVIVISFDGTATITGFPMPGYTQLLAHNANADYFYVYYKIANGTETATGTITSSVAENSVAYALQIRNVNQTTPMAGVTSFGASPVTTGPNPPSHTATGGQNYLWLAVANIRNGDIDPVPTVGSTGFSGYTYTVSGSTSIATGLGYCYKQDAASTMDPDTWNTPNASWYWGAATIAISGP